MAGGGHRRLCLDRLDLAESRRTTVTAEHPRRLGAFQTGGPDDVHDEVRQALSVVVDRLSPAERTSFVLHDIFGFPFNAVAGLVGRTRRRAGSWPAALACRSGAVCPRRARGDMVWEYHSSGPGGGLHRGL